MKGRLPGWWALAMWAGLATPAWAAPSPAAEKLDAPLPSIHVTGTARSGLWGGEGRVQPEAWASAVAQLPLLAPRRATREDTGLLGVEVTPSTLGPLPLPGPGPSFTQLQVGYLPQRLGQGSLWDARPWGPGWGTLWGGARLGADWWQGAGQLAWHLPDRFRVEAEGGHLRVEQALAGSQGTWGRGALGGSLDTWGQWQVLGQGGRLLPFGAPWTAPPKPGSPWDAGRAQARWRGQWPLAEGHALEAEGTAQWRQWGQQSGPEAYLRVQDSWQVAKDWHLDLGLGGGQWGFEPILDPSLSLRQDLSPQLSWGLGARTRSRLPDEVLLLRDRQGVSPSWQLGAERAEGEGELSLEGAPWPGWTWSAQLGLHRTHRLWVWAQEPAEGRWRLSSLASLQWGPQGQAELAWSPSAHWQLALAYRGRAAWPSAWSSQAASLSAKGAQGALTWRLGTGWRMEQLIAQQVSGGGLAQGLTGEGELRWALTPSWELVGELRDWGQPLGPGLGLAPWGLLPTASLGVACTF